MTITDYAIQMLQSGVSSLASYLAAHVLLCLVPAFFIAGAMTALVPKEAVTRYLGRQAPKWVSYPMAAVSGFVLAVCSCTILPLFASIYRRGAGLGPAITFLFVGPAINILAVSYTGVAIGLDIAVARVILSVVFGIGIGLIMALIFRRDGQAHQQDGSAAFDVGARVKPAVWMLMVLLLAVLVTGTLAVGVLKDSLAEFTLPLGDTAQWQTTLDVLVPYDAGQGQEGVTVQGTFLVAMLGLITITAWFGLNKIDEGFNRWSWLALSLISLTLLAAALQIVPRADGLGVGITGRFVAEVVILLAMGLLARRVLDPYQVQEWLWESWRFVKQIFPLLIVGVFAAGMLRVLIPPAWVQSVAGRNTFLANLVGVVFGVFMYFPTLVEVPIANMFLGLGMHRGPLLAYLMADPELSVQSILITARVIGGKRAWVYVAWVALFSTLAGLLYGAWVDGTAVGLIALYLAALLGLLAAGLWLVSRRVRPTKVSPEARRP